ncbi:MAG: FHA domain-containing protein [Planctomycetota bacterium]
MLETEDYVPSTTEGLSCADFCQRYPFTVAAVGLINGAAGEFQFLTMPDGTGPLVDKPGARPVLGLDLIRVRKRANNPFAQWITFGRAQNNDVVINATDMSKFHAYLIQAPSGAWRLVDAGSTNGSYLRGERLVPRQVYDVELATSFFLGSTQVTLLQGPSLYRFLGQLEG